MVPTSLTFGKLYRVVFLAIILAIAAQEGTRAGGLFQCELESFSTGGGWEVKRDNGTPVPIGIVGSCSTDWFWAEPIVLVRGTKIKAEATLKNIWVDVDFVGSFLYTGNAQMKIYFSVGPNSGGCEGTPCWESETPWVNVTVNQGVATIPLTESALALPTTGTGKSIVHLDFHIRIDENDFGTSPTIWDEVIEFPIDQRGSLEVYLLNSTPISTTDFYRTVVDVACPDAATSTGFIGPTTEAGIVQRIWQLFPSKNLYGDDFRPLYYYKPNLKFSETTATTVAELLAAQNGQCLSWARFFKAALSVHGISGEIYRVQRNKAMIIWDQGFLVKAFSFNTPTGTHSKYPYSFNLQSFCDGFGFFIDMVPVPPGSTYGDLVSQPTIAGQNTSPPAQKAFELHFVVKHGSNYYDPSYGATYDDRSDFESKALDAFYSDAKGFDCINNKTRLGVRRLNSEFRANLTSYTPSTLRNDSGWVGCRITVGNEPIFIRELGRFVISGNTLNHVVKLVHANGTDIPGGSVTVITSGKTPGTMSYTLLPQPIRLTANTTYYLVSQETLNGDQWYDWPTTVQTYSGSPSVSGAVYNIGGGYINLGGAGNTYGPVGFLYYKCGVNFTLTNF